MNQLFPKASLYHSDLVKHCGQYPDGLPCKLTTDIMPSKDKTGRIVRLLPYGYEVEHWLLLENAAVEATIAAVPKDTWVTIQATGMKDTAAVRVVDTSGTEIVGRELPSQGYPPPHPEPAPWAEPPSTTGVAPQQAPWPPPVGTPAVGAPIEACDRMIDALIQAHTVVQKVEAATGRPLDEHTRTIGISLFIQGHRR